MTSTTNVGNNLELTHQQTNLSQLSSADPSNHNISEHNLYLLHALK